MHKVACGPGPESGGAQASFPTRDFASWMSRYLIHIGRWTIRWLLARLTPVYVYSRPSSFLSFPSFSWSTVHSLSHSCLQDSEHLKADLLSLQSSSKMRFSGSVTVLLAAAGVSARFLPDTPPVTRTLPDQLQNRQATETEAPPAPIVSEDPWQCVTENITQYFDPRRRLPHAAGGHVRLRWCCGRYPDQARQRHHDALAHPDGHGRQLQQVCQGQPGRQLRRHRLLQRAHFN